MKQLILASLFLVIAQSARAVPAQVLIIRHGEKVNDGDPDLSEKGRKRAKGLIHLFLEDPRFNIYGPPVAIYAAAPKHSDSSARPEETVQPLADKLHLKVITDFNKKKSVDIANEIYTNPDYNNKTVVICWVHQTITTLAMELGAKEVPEKWRKHAFDRVWRIKYANGAGGPVEDLPEHLLPGDSD